jgi:cytochrome c-type biogenesis protein CcmH/NrfG
LYNNNNVGGAKQMFNLALQTAPDHVSSLLLLGLVEAGEGNNAEAKVHLQRVLEVAPPESTEAAQAREYLKSIK